MRTRNKDKFATNSKFAGVNFSFPNYDQTENVPAHKLILTSVTPVFATIFFGSLKESSVVENTDSNANAFKEFLYFVHLPEITLSVLNSEQPDYLECNVTMENVLTYELAVSSNNSGLKTFCEYQIDVLFTEKVILIGSNFTEQA